MSRTFPSYTCDEYNGCVPSLHNGQYQTQGQCMLNCPADNAIPASNDVWRVVDYGLDNDPHSTRPKKPLLSSLKAVQSMNIASNNIRGAQAPSSNSSYTRAFCGPDPMNRPWRGDANLNISLRPTPVVRS